MWMRLDLVEVGESIEVQVSYSWVARVLMMALTIVPLMILGRALSAVDGWELQLAVSVVCGVLTLLSSVLTLSVFLSTKVRVGPDGVHTSTPMREQRLVPMNEVQFFIHEPFALDSGDGNLNTGNHIAAIGTYSQSELPVASRPSSTSTDPIRFGLGVRDERLAALTERLNARLLRLSAAQ